MEEIWKQIDNYDYKISSFGRIKRGKNSMCPIKISESGYYYVFLWKNDNFKEIFIHRLVAKYFIKQKYKDKYIIDHINRVRTDNRVCNLRYVNHKENMNNRIDNTPEA